ncbi:tripartite tricarboxylate transporter substrate-binding protein [Cupriavidus sp. CV2]|uniref:Bug family tripartite tricarboxylate transporter substrate binding protein n=1 Tax=Cupriavidus ulmosensis TaxID=3065913 RepID=UPI00296AC7B9|nr:tripartite tricarboxylate transporter substrate-binding protein [Cupriavidus sp. CV2]MDW3680544.1 tripartite tricarboxylate transporter substrate-binding protein [Cupriavidus sp. CV2]
MSKLTRSTARRSALCLILALVATAEGQTAVAQGNAWPKGRPIKLMVAFTAGSATDVVARVIAPELSRLLDATVVVENKPGAGGSIAAGALVQAEPDGYTLLVQSSAHVVNPAFFPHLAYSTQKDIRGVAYVGTSLFVMVVSPAKGFKDVRDVVVRAKAQPGGLNYGSGGIGSGAHLNGAKFAAASGISVLHVPSRGTGEALTETMAGRLDWTFAPAPTVGSLIKEGRLQALAVGSATRSAAFPSVPSMSEAGFPSAAYASWIGVFAPARTPNLIVDRLNDAIRHVVTTPAVKARLEALGTEPRPMSPQEFDKLIGEELHTMAELVKVANIKPME